MSLRTKSPETTKDKKSIENEKRDYYSGFSSVFIFFLYPNFDLLPEINFTKRKRQPFQAFFSTKSCLKAAKLQPFSFICVDQFFLNIYVLRNYSARRQNSSHFLKMRIFLFMRNAQSGLSKWYFLNVSTFFDNIPMFLYYENP